jgi:hypothetical protein
MIKNAEWQTEDVNAELQNDSHVVDIHVSNLIVLLTIA